MGRGDPAEGRPNAGVSEPSPAAPHGRWMPRLAAAGAIVAVLGLGRLGCLLPDDRRGPDDRAWGRSRSSSPTRRPGSPEGGRCPTRFLSFHNGHASLFEYYHGPERKVYTDPRLEVAGASLFQEYLDLDKAIKNNDYGDGQTQLDQLERPVVMVDHEYSWADGATLLGQPHWRCVWFDPIVAVFVHDSAEEAVRSHAVDFAARHFRPDPSSRGSDPRRTDRAGQGVSATTSLRSPRIAPTWSGRWSGSAATRVAESSATSPTRPSPGSCSARSRSTASRPRPIRPARDIDCPSTPRPTCRSCVRLTRCGTRSNRNPTICHP